MNIAEYIDKLSSDRREDILQVRELIKNALPDAKESMQYRMPTFSVGNELMYTLTSQKTIGLFTSHAP